MHWIPRINAAALFVLCAFAHPVSARAAPQPVLEQDFSALEHEYAAYVLGRFPVVATYLGGAAFDPQLTGIDGKLRDYSPQALEREQARLSQYRERFSALDSKALDGRRRIDRSVALAQIDFMLHEQQVRRQQQRSLDSYLDEPFRGVDWQIQGMTSTGPTTYGTDTEWRAVLARTRAVPAYLRTAEAQLGAGAAVKNTPDWRMLEAGLETARADADYFSNTLAPLASKGLGPAQHDVLIGDLQGAGRDAAAAYEHLRKFLISEFFDNPSAAGVTAVKRAYRADHFELGETEYNWALHNNLRLDTDASTLFTQAWPVVLQTQGSMVSLAREIAASHRWPAPADGAATVRTVFERLTRDAPRDDSQMLEGYRRTGRRLMDYVRDSGLFDAPPDYRLEVTVTPEPLRTRGHQGTTCTTPS